MAKSELYKAAGVDIDLATNLLGKVKADLAATRRPEMLSPIGGFGGLFQIDLSKYKEPVMVSSIDGVGTKLMVAMMMEKYDTVGHDIVNHCINDISVQGAEPVYFMDYIGIGKIKVRLFACSFDVVVFDYRSTTYINTAPIINIKTAAFSRCLVTCDCTVGYDK